jgi:citronellol/citronellal dehydrogenase
MAEIDVSQVLRSGLLEGVPVALAQAQAAETGAASAAVRAACTKLGATVHELPLICTGEPEADDAAIDAALADLPGGGREIRMLVIDAGGLFSRVRAQGEDAGGPRDEEAAGAPADALIAALEASWRVTRAVANAAFIAGGRGGRIAYLAPPTGSPGAGEHADAARAGLENLARTLSIEWARYGITPVAIAPGPSTTPQELAGVVAYLASPAGSYSSGCLLDLTGPG